MLDRLLYRGAPRRLGGRFREVAGHRLYERFSETEGTPSAVLVHGVGVSGRYLLPTAGRLAGRCSVYVPDLPGFGRSGTLRGRPTVPRLSEVLEAWLDAAGIERPDILVANSFGCQLALELAAHRVSRLVLVGPTVDASARSLTRQAARLAVDMTREPLALWALETVDYALHVAKSGIAAFQEMLADPVNAKLSRITAPTVVVRGERDAIVPRDWAAEVARTLLHGRLVEIPGAPHAVNYAAPDALAQLIIELLEEPTPSAPSRS